ATRKPNKRRWEDARRRPTDYRKSAAREIRSAWTTRASRVPPWWLPARGLLSRRQRAALRLPEEDPRPARLRGLPAIVPEHQNVSTKKVQARRGRSRAQRSPAIFARGFFQARSSDCETVM